MMVVRQFEGTDMLVVHPTKGLTMEYLLNLAEDGQHYATFTYTMESLKANGWFFLSK